MHDRVGEQGARRPDATERLDDVAAWISGFEHRYALLAAVWKGLDAHGTPP